MKARLSPASKLLPALGALVALLLLGVVGFRVFFGSGWLFALYQTAMTVTTVGDARVAPATPGQYVFVGALALLGYAVWGLCIAIVAGILVSIDIGRRWGGPTVTERIAALSGHTIIVGGGRVGQHVASELRRHGQEVVVIERSPEHAARLTELGLLALNRDALEEGVFSEAGLERAAGVVLALPDDAQNLYALFAVRDIAPDVSVVARAESMRAERHLNALGVTRVVMPTTLGGKRMARLLSRPFTTDFLDRVVDEAGLEVQELPVAAGDGLADQPVRALRGHLGGAVTLLAIHRGGRFLSLPGADTQIRAGDVLVIVTRDEEAGPQDPD